MYDTEHNISGNNVLYIPEAFIMNQFNAGY